MPHSLCTEFNEKINCYVDAGWWEPCTINQAAPMLCVNKKDGHLCTIVDARQCNENTVKDMMPLPDMDIICEDVA